MEDWSWVTGWCNVCGHWDGYHHNPPHITDHLGERESFILRRLAPCSRVGEPPDALAPVQPEPPPCSASSTPTSGWQPPPQPPCPPSSPCPWPPCSTSTSRLSDWGWFVLIYWLQICSKRSLCCKKNQPGGVFFHQEWMIFRPQKEFDQLGLFLVRELLAEGKKTSSKQDQSSHCTCFEELT